MGYSREVYRNAAAALAARRAAAEREASERRAAFFEACPRAAQIERELARTGVAAARAVLAGGNVRENLTRLKESNLALQREQKELLRQAGLPEDHLTTRYTCAACGDTGYIDGKMCACLRQALREEACRELNELSPLTLSTFETFSLDYYPEQVRPAMEKLLFHCMEYAKSFSFSSPNIIMMGSTGLGKTHLSLAIARAVIDRGYGVVYGSVNNLIDKLEREHFGRDEEASTRQSLMDCDLLILDDLGTEFRTAFSVAEVYNLINTRQMTRRPTIISTNLTMKELETAYTNRFTSRIMADYVRCLFQGDDIRQKKRMLGAQNRTRQNGAGRA